MTKTTTGFGRQTPSHSAAALNSTVSSRADKKRSQKAKASGRSTTNSTATDILADHRASFVDGDKSDSHADGSGLQLHKAVRRRQEISSGFGTSVVNQPPAASSDSSAVRSAAGITLDLQQLVAQFPGPRAGQPLATGTNGSVDLSRRSQSDALPQWFPIHWPIGAPRTTRSNLAAADLSNVSMLERGLLRDGVVRSSYRGHQARPEIDYLINGQSGEQRIASPAGYEDPFADAMEAKSAKPYARLFSELDASQAPDGDALQVEWRQKVLQVFHTPNAAFEPGLSSKTNYFVDSSGALLAEVSTKLRHGTFSEVFMADYPNGDLGVLRTVYLAEHDEQGADRRVKLSKLKNVASELAAMQAIDSPLLPIKLYSTGVGDLRYFQPRYDVDLFNFGVYWQHYPDEAFDKAFLTAAVAGLLRDILSQLATLHDQGFAHQDLKPENILVNKDGAVLADFGLTTRFDGNSLAKDATTGTPRYFPPELLNLQKSDATWRGELTRPYSLLDEKELYDPTKKDIFAAGLSMLFFIAGPKSLDKLHWTTNDNALAFTESWFKWFARGPKETNASLLGAGAQAAAQVEMHTSEDILQLLSLAMHPNPAERPSARALAERAQQLADVSHLAMGMSREDAAEEIKYAADYIFETAHLEADAQ